MVLIFGITGACRGIELTNITIENIEQQGQLLVIKLPNTKTKIDRTFVVPQEFSEFVQKYRNLRPENVNTNRFFLKYHQGKCYKQVIGKNTIRSMPKQIASYLKLANPELYTGHCFRRTSATLLADAGANLTTIKRHGGWKSSKVAEGYIEDSIQNKSKITNQITKTIQLSKNETSFSRDDPQLSTSAEESFIPSDFVHDQQISQSQTINIPKKHLSLKFENCSHFTINFN